MCYRQFYYDNNNNKISEVLLGKRFLFLLLLRYIRLQNSRDIIIKRINGTVLFLFSLIFISTRL